MVVGPSHEPLTAYRSDLADLADGAWRGVTTCRSRCRGRSEGLLAGLCRQQPAQLWPARSPGEGRGGRALGDVTTALKHYDRAIELAEAEGYTHLVGLANKRAAVCCLASEHH